MNTRTSPYFNKATPDSVDKNSIKNLQLDKGETSALKKDSNSDTDDEILEDVVTHQTDQPCSPEMLSRQRLKSAFFQQECIALAKALLGQRLVRLVDGVRVSGTIVETESYLGGNDEASHSANGKKTRRNEPMYMKEGTFYVYSIYGMYYCANISSEDEGSCVLIRALEPTEGIEKMIVGRSQRRSEKSKPLKTHELCSGPSKLCQALTITKALLNKADLTTSKQVWLESGSYVPEEEIVITKRVGIESSGPESANKLQRFYVYNNKNVSVRDKKLEAKLFPG